MFFKFLIPLIAMILLRNIGLLSEMSERVIDEFDKDYRVLTCARQDVYRRNLEEAVQYLAGQYDYVDSEMSLEDLLDFEEGGDDCRDQNFAVYREYNPSLPAVYPNWVYRETEGGD